MSCVTATVLLQSIYGRFGRKCSKKGASFMGRAVTELDEIRYMDIVQLTSINQEASRTKRRHIDTEVVGALDPDAKFPIVEHWYEDGRVTMTVGLDCEWCGVIETTLDSFKGLPIHVVGA